MAPKLPIPRITLEVDVAIVGTARAAVGRGRAAAVDRGRAAAAAGCTATAAGAVASKPPPITPACPTASKQPQITKNWKTKVNFPFLFFPSFSLQLTMRHFLFHFHCAFPSCSTTLFSDLSLYLKFCLDVRRFQNRNGAMKLSILYRVKRRWIVSVHRHANIVSLFGFVVKRRAFSDSS